MDRAELIKKLQEVADTKPGEYPPVWLYEDDGNWGTGLSKLLQAAIVELNKMPVHTPVPIECVITYIPPLKSNTKSVQDKHEVIGTTPRKLLAWGDM